MLPPFDKAKEDRTMREMLTTPQIVMTAIKKAKVRVVFDIEGVSPLEVFLTASSAGNIMCGLRNEC